MSQIGALSIAITADGGQAIREMGDVDSKQKKTFADMGKNLRTSATQWAKWGAAAVAAAVGTYAALVRSQMGVIDSLANTSDKIGIATEELQALRHAAELTGVSTGTLDTALQRMTRRVAEAAQGTGAAKEALEELGLDAQALARLSPDEVFRNISDAMEGVASQGDRVRLAMRLFDTEGVALVNTMKGGREALDAYKQEVKDFGLAISRVDAAKVEQANSALFRAGEVMRGALTKAAVEVAPIITEISNRFIEAATDAETFGNVTDKVFSGIVYTVGKVGDVFHGWRIIVKSIEAAFYGLSTVVDSVMLRIIEAVRSAVGVGLNTIISGLNNIPGVKLDEIVVGETEFISKLKTTVNSAQIEFADAMFELRKLASEPLPSEQFEAFVQRVKDAADEVAATQRQLTPIGFSPIVINSNDEAIEEIHAALRSAEDALEASYKERTAIVAEERQKRLDVIEHYNQQEQAMLAAQGEAAEYQSQVDDIRAKKQQELAVIQELEAAKEAALRALPAIDAYTSQAEWIRKKKEEELAVIEQLETAKAHMLETGADNTHIEQIEAQLAARLEAFQDYAQKEAQVMGMISEAQTFGGVEMDLAQIEEQLAARLELVTDYNQREQELLAQVQEAQARGGSEEDIAALQQEREALLEQIQYYNELELALQEEHAEALRGIVRGDDKYSEEANEAWLNGLRERNMTELELLEQQTQLEQERLLEALEQELLTREEYNELMTESEARAADARMRIAEAEAKSRSSVMSGMMTNLSQLMNTGSKKMFAIGKAAAVAQALIAGKEAVVNSYNAGSRIGGPPVGAAFAATAAVATAAQINQIRSQSFGGGSNPTTFSGGLPAVRTVDAGQSAGPVNPSQRVDINITGSGNTFTAEQVRELIGQINDQLGDGVNLAFGG